MSSQISTSIEFGYEFGGEGLLDLEWSGGPAHNHNHYYIDSDCLEVQDLRENKSAKHWCMKKRRKTGEHTKLETII